MSVGQDNNRQTERLTGVQYPKGTHSYKEYSNQIGYRSKVLGVHILNPRIMSVGEDNKRQTDRQTYSSQKHKLK